MLKYFHPSLFNCYYAGKETYQSFWLYLTSTSWKDIAYNCMYKSGFFLDSIRTIY